MQQKERECPQCGNAFTGRADKQCCSEACKAQYRRNNLDDKFTDDDNAEDDADDEEWDAENDDWDDDDEDVEPDPPLHQKVSLIERPSSSYTQLEKADEEERQMKANALELIRLRQLRIDAQLRQEAADKAAEEVEKIKSLHTLYSTLIKKCLKQDGYELNERDLKTWVEELDGASEKYLSHPGLRQPEDKAHKRLKDLYWLGDMFSGLLTELREQQSSFFKSVEPVYLELPSKRKARFREHLVA